MSNRTTLKGYFNSGDVPTEANFADLIDSTALVTEVTPTGWADYADSTYTDISPLALVANTDTVLPNDGVNGPKTQIPTDFVNGFYTPHSILFDALTASFTVGDTVTGGTSGATAEIHDVQVDGTTGTLFIGAITGGPFVDNETITDVGGGSATVNDTTFAGKILGQTGDAYILTINMTTVPTSAGTTQLEVWVDIGGTVGELYRRIITFPKGQGVAREVTFTTGIYTLNTWQQNGGTVYIRANGTADIYNIRFVPFRIHKAI